MRIIVVIIAGVFIGGWLGDGFGAAAGAVLAWLADRSLQQARTIAALHGKLELLSARRSGPLSTPAVTTAVEPDLMLPDAAVGHAPGNVGAAGAALASVAAQAATPSAAAAAAAAAPSASPAVALAQAPAAAVSRQQPGVVRTGTPADQDAAGDSLWRDEPPDTEVGSLWGDVAPASTPSAAASARGQPGQAAPPGASQPVLAQLQQWLFGGNTIVKLGVAILFIGLAFLAKFASEHVHVPVEFRLAGIGAAALALLVLGWRLRDTRAAYAQVLQGGAVAVLYLTLFVAFRFYGVLAVLPVFVCMVAVAALAAALAVLQDARALAVIGALGGFATPLLVSSGSGDHVALFSYYLVLDLGIAFVAWHRHWKLLNLIGFAGTFIIGTAWGVLKYRSEHYASSQTFLIIYFLLFTAILLMPARQGAARRQARDNESPTGSGAAAPAEAAWINASLLFGLPTITFVLQHGMVRDTDYGTALSALVLALFYVGQAAWMRSRPHLAVTFDASLAMATVFLTLVIPFALDAHNTAGAWALEGAGLVWLGWRQRRALPRGFGYLLLLLAGAAMLHARQQHGAPLTWLNGTLFNGLMLAAGSLAAAWFVQRAQRAQSAQHGDAVDAAAGRDDADFAATVQGGSVGKDAAAPAASRALASASLPNEAIAEPLLIAWATLWLAATVGTQIDALVDARYGLAAWLTGGSAIALLYTGLARRFAWRQIAWPVLGHAPLLALAVVASALLQHSPSQDGGWWAWPVALLTHGLVLRHVASVWPAPAAATMHTLGVLVIAALGALQGRAVTADWGDANSAWAWLGWLVVPALLVMVLQRAAIAPRWPVSAAPSAYRTTAGAVLAAGLLLWTLLANLASNGAASPLPHVPLLNPLDLGVGVALFAVALWLRSDAAQPLLRERPAVAPQVLAVAGFVWLNAMLVRAFHHYGDVPYRFDAWVRSLAVQTGITLLWSVTALVLMWWSARRALRGPWIVGAGLLGAVVLKLVLVDLSGSGTVTRIVSFIGVGVLMLVIGYVAPLPGAATKEASHGSA